MADRKVVDEWLRLADEDFGFAVSNLDDPATSYFAPICFHFHQAAEKYFKAFIVAQWVPQAVSVITFAVITINTLYYGTHRVLEQKLQFDNVLDTKL